MHTPTGHTATTEPGTYIWEGRCAGCGRWETFTVSVNALHAIETGELTVRQAMPLHSGDQRCLIEMHCHIDCYDDAIHHRPPGEPSPFAAQ